MKEKNLYILYTYTDGEVLAGHCQGKSPIWDGCTTWTFTRYSAALDARRPEHYTRVPASQAEGLVAALQHNHGVPLEGVYSASETPPHDPYAKPWA